MAEPDDMDRNHVPAEAVPAEEAPPKRSGWPLRLAKLAIASVLGLIALLGISVIVLDTAPGHRFVADQIGKFEFENGMRIRIGRIEGSLFNRMSLRAVSVTDPRGEFLFSPEIRVDWRPFAFLRNHVDIQSATAQRVTLRRLPQFRAVPPSDEPLLPDIDIDIGRLRIDRFIAEPAVSGEQRIASIRGKAHIADRRAQIDLDGKTIAGQGKGGGDRLTVRLDAVPEANRLAINVALDAPKGGTIAALAGLTEASSVRIDGKGDWKSWDGKLAADLAGQELARLTLAARDGTFNVKGPARLARLVSGPTANLLGPSTAVDLTAALKERRADLSGTVSSNAFTLNADGLVDLSDNSFDDLKLAFVLLRPSVLAENLSGSGLRALLTLNGAFTTPRVQYSINAARIAMNDMALEQFTASGVATVDADHIRIPVKARVARITGLDTVAGGTLRNVTLAGDVAVNGPRILSDNMRIRSDRIDAKVILLADTSKGIYTGAIDGRINNYRVESVGIFDIETDVDLESVKTGGFALAGKVRARSRQLFNDGVRNFLGGDALASTDVRYGPDGVVRFANLRVDAPAFRMTGGQGSYSPQGQITFNADAVSDQYGRLGVRLAGTISNPRAHVTAERPGLGIGLANLEAEITGAPGGYRLNATGDTDYGPLIADVTLGMRGPLTLQINSARLAEIAFAGLLTQTSAGPFAGQLTANGSGLAGVVRLAAQGKFQEVLFNLRANDTVLPGPANLSIGSAIIDARMVLYEKPYIVADAQISDTQVSGFDINAGRILIDYRDGKGHAKAVIEGGGQAPFRLAANADLQPNLWRAMLQGRMRGVSFKTTSPARIVPGEKGYELLPTRIEVGRGNVRVAGTYGEGIKIQSRLDAMDLSIINAIVPGYGLSGQATGSFDFEQATEAGQPRADVRLSIDDFRRTTAAAVSAPVDVNFVGKLLPDGGEARAVFRQRGSVIGRLVASLGPLPATGGSWLTRLQAAPLSGGIRYNGPADTLFSFAGQADQRLSGPVGVAADFSCNLSSPCINGVIRGNSLTYEHHTYGTRLTNMAVSGRFTGNRLEIEKLTATAGPGTVSAQGNIGLAADAGYPMDLSATLDNARLARSDSLSARATGELRLTKTAGQTALLSGELRLPETRYKIIRQGAAEVPELTGVRFKQRRGRQLVTGDEQGQGTPSLFSLLRLDIRLRAPDELYVSGMGLESEWKADLRVSGTSAAPNLVGEVELVRGTLDFAGRSFSISEGRIGFTGGNEINPTVQVVATEDVDDVTVNVNIGGRALNPQITFASVPALPQDEILSRILFGSSISNISAIQAVQLAASLNALRGSGGGLNPLGKLRSATGIDRLRVLSPDEETGRGTALAAGQYLSDDIYVELITDTRGFTATQLEISLTPWLSILSQAGGSGVTNFNVRVKKNY